MNEVEAWLIGELKIAKHKVAEAHRTGVLHGILTKEEEGFLCNTVQNLGDALACLRLHGRKRKEEVQDDRDRR